MGFLRIDLSGGFLEAGDVSGGTKYPSRRGEVGRAELLLEVACVVVRSSGCGSAGSFSDWWCLRVLGWDGLSVTIFECVR